jgi:hypothetical protein
VSDVEAAQGILVDGFGRVREGVAELTTGLTDETAWWRPDPGANSIAWLLWHLTRVQDDSVVAGLAGGDRIWAGFRDEAALPLDPDDTGYGHSTDQVAQVRVSADLLDRYHAAVHAATLHYLATITDAELQCIVDERWPCGWSAWSTTARSTSARRSTCAGWPTGGTRPGPAPRRPTDEQRDPRHRLPGRAPLLR